MQEYLLEVDIQEILKIPISSDPGEDRLRWHFTDSGNYTVRSGYEVAMAKQRDRVNTGLSSQTKDTSFTKLWKLKMDRKITHLIWRVVKGILPTAVNLRRRNIRTPEKCCFCKSKLETERHLFVECDWVKIFWKKQDIGTILSKSTTDLGESLLGCIKSKGELESVKACITIWGIWTARNSWIFKHKKITQEAAANMIQMKIEEQIWKKEKSHDLISVFEPSVARSEARHAVNVTFDAGWMPESHQTTAGVVICSADRKLIAAAALSLPPAESARHAEALACVEALRLASSLQAPAVFLAGNSTQLMDGISAARERKGKRELGALQETMQVILDLLSNFETLELGFCGRDGVSVAHYLATHVARGGAVGSWFQLLPSWLHRKFEKASFG